MTYKKLLDLIDLDYVGLENVKKFSWKKTAEETLSAYRETIGK